MGTLSLKGVRRHDADSLRHAVVVHGTALTLRIRRHEGSPNRFSAVVSKKVEPQAVSRNKLKRRILGVAREVLSSDTSLASLLPAVGLFFAKQQAASLSPEELRREIGVLFRTARRRFDEHRS